MNASLAPVRVPRTSGTAENAGATRSAKLRQMLLSPELEFILEAHNGLSARIVRETGFKGI